MKQILRIDASARISNSYSRMLTTALVSALRHEYPQAKVQERDIYADLRFSSETTIAAMASSQKSDDGHSLQEILIHELLATDLLILGVPVYNFSIPAALKAYIDLVVRAGYTFRYGAGGPEGLVKNLRVIAAVTSNGTALHGPGDFVSGYLKYIFSFIGVNDIQFIDATQLLLKGADRVMKDAQQKINSAFMSQPAA